MAEGTGHARRTRRDAQDSHWEYRVVRIPPTTSRDDARRLLADEAEYGRWELARLRLYAGGERRVWLRRRMFRVRSTLAETLG